uniref:Uncharacterized protein n=1 Tax=Eucampia antarctica TaxID=49252 RepID=A0A7S2R067_9STRA|mmetsp:Transcript_11377/g.10887  ORF Transcript_11377/g.10887 Transcript_11377/m.10887 type:complete len:143 (+) Transcript_11377:232-660(+)
MVVQKDGTKKYIWTKDVKYVPELYCNLFIISAALKEGCTLEGNQDYIKIKKKIASYMFDCKIKSGKGILYGIKIETRKDDKIETTTTEGRMKKEKLMSLYILSYGLYDAMRQGAFLARKQNLAESQRLCELFREAYICNYKK